ncbi:hypothetical protein ES703_82211 [subsurface metagenome]
MITANNTGKYPVYLSKAYFICSRRSPKKYILFTGPNNFKTEKLEPGTETS